MRNLKLDCLCFPVKKGFLRRMIKRLLLYLILEFKLWTMFMCVTTLFPFDLANHFCEMAADYHYETPHILDHDEFGNPQN
ncbi:hypothetical protein FRX31_020463 [Thalictrum thalictroides]|uniref:Uncharacterized protein n=1 Tax=Thalictrum thalictroides TaxID=46969 RepID=A0A7J6VYL2_THATH|nr:hypothetical protein FRX31_020463 [Thalictrum thalictroides]